MKDLSTAVREAAKTSTLVAPGAKLFFAAPYGCAYVARVDKYLDQIVPPKGWDLRLTKSSVFPSIHLNLSSMVHLEKK